MLRAAKALQEMAQLHQQDLQGRLEAEQKLIEAYGEIQKLKEQLNEKNNTSTSSSSSPDGVSHPAAET
jgi:hypothetical protein